MRLAIRAQALALLSAAGLGLLLGLCYDLLRPPRWRSGAVLASLLDWFFGLLVAGAAFVHAMSAGEGRLGLWSLTAALLGFLLYWQLLGPLFSPVIALAYDDVYEIIGWLKKIPEKLQNFAKKTFPNVRK